MSYETKGGLGKNVEKKFLSANALLLDNDGDVQHEPSLADQFVSKGINMVKGCIDKSLFSRPFIVDGRPLR